MRIAHVTTDEVNQALADRAARPLGALVTPLATEDHLTHESFDAVLLDLDRVSPDRRQALLDEIRSEATALPMAVYGYCLSEEQAGKLRFHGVAVAQRLHSALVRTLAKSVRQNLATVPPDDAITDLTWVNLNA
jgi:hypothetical protein